MPLIATRGAASAQGFGEFAQATAVNYIEDVFSTYLYTGTGATQTITNNIDLSTKGGLVWIKGRSGTTGHRLTDTARGATKSLASETTAAEATETTGLTAFGTTGFTIGADADYNTSAATYVSWSLRKQLKFFDILTYTGTGSTRSVSHNLGCVPGFIIVKNTSNTADWAASLAPDGDWNNRKIFLLNTTDADGALATYTNGFINTATSTTVSLTQNAGTNVNASGNTYVMYLFAHNAGGFGLTGADNVISCGSFTTDGSGNATVNLGYEPQWFMVKSSSNISNWAVTDNMRGMTVGHGTNYNPVLVPNSSAAENTTGESSCIPTATGFYTDAATFGSSRTYIYIAIRRGPMKVPTTGTSVFAPVTSSATTGTSLTTNFPIDFQLYKQRNAVNFWLDVDRLRGVNTTTTANATPWLDTVASSAEVTNTTVTRNWGNTGFEMPGAAGGLSYVFYNFQRAPSFMDSVCYNGTGTSTAVSHNLAAVPELMIVKARSTSGKWTVYNAPMGNTAYMFLEETTASQTNIAYWSNTTPTASNFTVNALNNVNGSGITYVAYLFATCAGVSKVGSYAGTGATQTINCGFGAGGARFVLIKRTDDVGDWYAWDTARGMISGTDPSLLVNSYAAEVNANSVYAISTGFQIVSTAAGINSSASGATYIFLAIA